MWIEAILTPRDCADFIGSITPLKIDLGAGRQLVIARPKRVHLVPKKGLRLQTAGHVVWTLAGVKVPVSVRIASLLLAPSLEKKDDRDVLGLRLRVEKLDVDVLPDFIDETVLHRINDTLAKHDDALVWAFAKALDRRIPLPARVESADAVDVRTRWAEVKITEDAIVFAVSLDVRATRAGRPIDAAAE